MATFYMHIKMARHVLSRQTKTEVSVQSTSPVHLGYLNLCLGFILASESNPVVLMLMFFPGW